MEGPISFATLCLILANSLTHCASAGSGESVHIRLHMPEIVRKHTHFHKVYKVVPPSFEPPMHHHKLQQHYPPYGKPHVSLLGYTTTASGTGMMSPNLMQVMASAATPMSNSMVSTLKPNYGPALFDNYNQDVAEAASLTTATTTTTPATFKPNDSGSGSFLATAPATAFGSGSFKSPQQQLLQQIFTPNILAAISASQQQKKQQLHINNNNNDNNHNIEMQSELELEQAAEQELENNELLNNNFLAALQHEYFNKFGSGTRKRKKVHFQSNYRRVPPKKTTNYVQESEEQYDDYQEESPRGYGDKPSAFGNDDDEEVTGYDSAAAFSGQSNGISLMPTTVDEFLSDVNSQSYDPFYGNMYDDYGPSSEAIGHNDWHSSPPPPPPTFSTYARPTTKATPPKLRLRQRRPSPELSSATGNGGKVRYMKLTTRKKRKNRNKSKRYRI